MIRLLAYTLVLALLAWVVSGSPRSSVTPLPSSFRSTDPIQFDVEPLLRSTVMVQVVNQNGPTAATGFIFDKQKGLVVTCSHVLHQAKSIQVQLPHLEAGKVSHESQHYNNMDEQRKAAGMIRSATILNQHKEQDLALLEVGAIESGDFEQVTLADVSPEPGSAIVMVGQPTARNQLWLVIHGEAGSLGEYELAATTHTLQATLQRATSQQPLEYGFSGGPVLDKKTGKVVGMVTGSQGKHSPTFYIVTVKDIRRLITR